MENYFEPEKKISRKELKKYELIGDGKDGEIYLLDPNKCVKYFFLEETQRKEYEALMVGQASSVLPKVYESGNNYIVMEFVQGHSLDRHMKKYGTIDEELTKKILFVLDEFKRVGFNRIDTEVRHILINEQGQLKVIDHKRAFSTSTSVPSKLIKGLDKYRLSKQFLKHVKNVNPSLYRAWGKK
jgi:putative serine/threonine protein kinase